MQATLGLKVNLKNQPNMIRLKKEDEDLAVFQSLPTEETLLRWLNYHLRNAGSDKVAKNFSGDLKVYSYLNIKNINIFFMSKGCQHLHDCPQ